MWFTNLRAFRKFLRNNRLFSVVIILGFAVSLLFVFLLSVYVKQELSVDHFHKNKERIYLLCADNNRVMSANPVADYVKDNCPEVECYTRLVSRSIPLSGTAGGEKRMIRSLFADPDFFNIFSFRLEEGDPAGVLATRQSAVITPSLAKSLFPGENPIGKEVYLSDSSPLTITGVMAEIPENTQIPQADILINYYIIEHLWHKGILSDWSNCSFCIYFMAKEGTDLPAKAPVLLEKFKQGDYWLYKGGFATQLSFLPLLEVYFGGVVSGVANIQTNSKTQVSVYLVITILILVVAILNYINLSVAQAGKRGKEAAMKKLLGCSKKQLIFQFVSESVFMTLIALVLGGAMAFASEPFFNRVLNTQLHLGHNLLDPLYLTILLVGVLLIGVLTGLVPAWTVARFQPVEVIKGAYEKNVKSVYSKILITFQYTVAFSLLACSLFIVKQTRFIRNYYLGFDQEQILILTNVVGPERIPALRNLLQAIPGVDNVSFSAGTPVDGGNNSSFVYKGQAQSFQFFKVDSNFLSLYNIPVTPTGITNSTVTFLTNQKGLRILEPDTVSYTFQIEGGYPIQLTGIVGDFHFRPLYQEMGQVLVQISDHFYAWSVSVKINKNADLFATVNQVKEAYSGFTGGEPFDATFVDETVQMWYEGEEKLLNILTAFTILTFVILLMGIIAMSLFFVRQRKKEIGIRKVNGAHETEILIMLNAGFLKWIALAFVLSVPLVVFAMRNWLEGFAYKTELSWWIFAVTGAVVLLLSVVSITLQTWKAATVNPVHSIKSE